MAGDTDHFRVVIETLAQEFDIVDIAAAAVKMAHMAAAGDGDDKEIPVPAPGRPETERQSRRPEGRAAAGPFVKTAGATKLVKGRAERWPRERVAGAPGYADRVRRASHEGGDTVRLFVGAGRQAGIRPGDLVGAITGEAGVESRALGAIEIGDRFSLVEVPEAMADAIISAMKKTTLRGQKVTIRRERF